MREIKRDFSCQKSLASQACVSLVYRTEVCVREGKADFLRLDVSSLTRLERRVGCIYNSHLIWLMHSELFQRENTLGEEL